MNPIQIQYALAVAELESFSAAARRFGVQQSTISNGVSNLESKLGGKLFRRTTRRVALSPFGASMLPFLEHVAAANRELLESAESFRQPDVSQLRLGFSPIIDVRALSSLVDPYRKQHSAVEVVFEERSVRDLERELSQGNFDFIFGLASAPSPERKESVSLGTERVRFVPPGAEVPIDSSIEVSAMCQYTIALTTGMCGLAGVTRSLFKDQPTPPDYYSGEALSYTALQEWAKLELGGAVLPESRIRGERMQWPVVCQDGEAVVVEYEARWLQEALEFGHLRSFVAHLRGAHVKEVSKGARWLCAAESK